jgi:Fic family protein
MLYFVRIWRLYIIYLKYPNTFRLSIWNTKYNKHCKYVHRYKLMAYWIIVFLSDISISRIKYALQVSRKEKLTNFRQFLLRTLSTSIVFSYLLLWGKNTNNFLNFQLISLLIWRTISDYIINTDHGNWQGTRLNNLQADNERTRPSIYG